MDRCCFFLLERVNFGLRLAVLKFLRIFSLMFSLKKQVNKMTQIIFACLKAVFF